MFIVVYRPHNVLGLDTKYFGPFTEWGAAYEYLCTLPALGICEEVDNVPYEPGYKFIQELITPKA